MKELHPLQLVVVFFFHPTTLRHFVVDFSVNSFYCLFKRLLSTYLKMFFKGVSGEIAGTEGFDSRHNYTKAWQSKILTN